MAPLGSTSMKIPTSPTYSLPAHDTPKLKKMKRRGPSVTLLRRLLAWHSRYGEGTYWEGSGDGGKIRSLKLVSCCRGSWRQCYKCGPVHLNSHGQDTGCIAFSSAYHEKLDHSFGKLFEYVRGNGNKLPACFSRTALHDSVVFGFSVGAHACPAIYATVITVLCSYH